MPSRDERRRHYDDFVAHVRSLCRTPRIRQLLEEGRGRPVIQCPDLDKYLAKPSRGFGAQRAHYTIASLIAMERPAPDWTLTSQPAAPEEPGTTATAWEAADWADRPNLGDTLARTACARPHAASGLERDLHLMGRLSADQLHRRLPHVIGHLLKLGAACDFAVLLDDLAQWNWARFQVTSDWRNAFYLNVPDPLLEP
ncbi:type I-E CRISPR-associated protein Cse2/CasB [Streptomyces sp. NPDC048415]|uniref:type I-E CRISPR-associated protein Cse2/CasB n=1 Tax=Streptomyces sp. NPDC048415 TaxID=3154822 RepID=UPI003415BC06